MTAVDIWYVREILHQSPADTLDITISLQIEALQYKWSFPQKKKKNSLQTSKTIFVARDIQNYTFSRKVG